MPVVDTTVGALDDTFRDLRALGIGLQSTLFGYVGLDRDGGRHVIEVSGHGRRKHGHVIRRNEARSWVEGMALARGDTDTIDQILGLDRAHPPKMMFGDEAASRIPSVDPYGNIRAPRIGQSGLEYMIKKGTVYPVYGPDGVRRFFGPQVEAVAAARQASALDREARTAAANGSSHRRIDNRAAKARINASEVQGRWAEIEASLPPLVLLDNADVGPAHRPGQSRTAVVDALDVGTARGWFTYLYPWEGDYLVDIPVVDRDPIRRRLAANRVLPWVEGFACWHRMDRLTFR